ncbi:bacterial transcriptional activator domain-containing protein [Pseudonocardia zijingensis]|uniref:Bacterial transcriptional activator domain-containing protein n=1 Tax=Pseudonocardia zijingensis TaxID=153376 RepID=A0ABN1NDJ8_9PSEU
MEKGIRVRIQLHGRFAVRVAGRAAERELPGRRGRLLVAYLAAHRLSAVDRDALLDVLWYPGDPGSSAVSGLTVLLSKARAALAPIEIRGRSSLQLVLPPGALVDADVAAAALHDAESAIGRRDWPRAWTQGLSALFVTQREFLSDLDHPWVDDRRRAAAYDHERALACYAEACLHLGPAELPSAERSARRLVELQPLSETGYALLMRALVQRGDRAAAVLTYERLTRVLRDDLGVSPSPATQSLLDQLI